jgi:hypothetical protein
MDKLWFGIPGAHMQYVPCPSISSNIQRNRYVERMQFENGGGDARRSVQYQMEYQFNVSGPAHEVEGIDAFNKFASGFYGDGLIYLAHPANFETNLFPAAWATPALIEQGWANIATSAPTFANTNVSNYGQPPRTATWNITDQRNTYTQSVTLVIPPTHTLHLGVSGVATGNGVVRVAPINVDGSNGTDVDLTLLSKSSSTRMNTTFAGSEFQAVRLYITRTEDAPVVRVNLVENPNFEADTNGWSGVSSTVSSSTVEAKYGARSALVSPSENTGGISYSATVVSGKEYNFSAWVYSAEEKNLKVSITNPSTSGTTTTVAAETWTRLNVTFTANSTSSVLSVLGTDSDADFYVDGVVLEEASSPGTFFDGDTLNTSGVTNAWSGEENDSTSIQTIANQSTVSITSMMAQLYKTGSTPTLPTAHYTGEGSTGLMFTDDAIVETYSYMYPPRKGIATTLVEVEAWR